jgi:FlaA1/EpsC-like NDP-sugar epimerase
MIQHYLQRQFKKHAAPQTVLLIDVLLTAGVFILAHFIRFELSVTVDVSALLLQTGFMCLLALVAFMSFNTFRGVIRETTVKDASKIIYATMLQLLLALSAVQVLNTWWPEYGLDIPNSVLIINWLLLTVVLVIARFVFKYLYSRLQGQKSFQKNALIYGAGNSGVLTLQAIESDYHSAYRVLGFMDDDARKCKKQINRMPIYYAGDVNEALMAELQIHTVIISIQNIGVKPLQIIVDRLLACRVKVQIVPPVTKWLEGNLQPHQIKPLEIDDLLNRAPIALFNQKLNGWLAQKTVLITGAAGSIGAELVRQVSACDYRRLILVDQAESALYDIEQELQRLGKTEVYACVADVCDTDSMALIFESHRPQLVIHAAAYKHVPLMEQNPYRAIRTNLRGTKVVADLALEYGTEDFLLVSTDKAVNPTNIMGATKRAAELYLTALAQNQQGMTITITRFGNVLGSNGSVIPLFKQQLQQGGPLTVTHPDIIRFFMTIAEACTLILEAGVMGKGGEIYVFDMGDPVRIFDLAKRMIELSGLRYPQDIDIKVTGLRPGEKLYEELLADKEQTLPTHHPKIMIAATRPLNAVVVRP